ncbi:MAG TPA: hypothetical protein VF077_09755 [Nitrospiraceae bacterium]
MTQEQLDGLVEKYVLEVKKVTQHGQKYISLTRSDGKKISIAVNLEVVDFGHVETFFSKP